MWIYDSAVWLNLLKEFEGSGIFSYLVFIFVWMLSVKYEDILLFELWLCCEFYDDI